MVSFHAHTTDLTASLHFAILPDWTAPEINHLAEAPLKRLGTRVLWVSDFSEIPERLGRMYEAVGGRWRDVFQVAVDRSVEVSASC
ncbi:MAG: hypothetical protein E3J21_10985 [Anaerolineales bacterium]|nr:MAG: hypothetical protein E3J21_10985 [Anaerolineales bacterium]